MATGKLLRQFKGKSTAGCCAISPDGKLLATDLDGKFGLWEIATGKLLAERKLMKGKYADTPLPASNDIMDRRRKRELSMREYVAAVFFSPDKIIVASTVFDGDKFDIYLRDARTGKLLRTWEGNPKRYGYEHRMAFSPDGNRLIAQEFQDGYRVIQVLDRISGNVIFLDKAANGAVWSPTGTIVATYKDEGGARLWDVTTGKELHRLPNCGPRGPARPPVFSPDGKILAGRIGTKDVEGIAFWDVASGKELRHCQNSKQTSGILAFSPDGKTLASMEHAALSCWEVASGKKVSQVREFQSLIRSLEFTADGKSVVTVEDNGLVYLWDARSGQQRAAFPQSARPNAPYMVGAYLSPSGQILAVGLSDSDPREQSTYMGVWDAVGGRELRRLEKLPEADALAGFISTQDRNDSTAAALGLDNNFLFSPDRKFLAYKRVFEKGDDTRFESRLWALDTGKLLPHRFPGVVQAISPDSTVLATTQFFQGISSLWEIATGKKLGEIQTKKDLSLAHFFSPTGQELMIASMNLNFDARKETKTEIQLFPLYRDKQLGLRIGVSRIFLEIPAGVTRFAFRPMAKWWQV